MYYDLYSDAMPMGFGLSLAQNMEALNRFYAMTEKQRSELMDRTKGIKSPDEMRAFVDSIALGQIF